MWSTVTASLSRIAGWRNVLLDTRTPRRMRVVFAAIAASSVHASRQPSSGAPVGVDEVVDQPRVVEAQLLGLEELVEHAVPVHACLAQEQPEAQRRWDSS